MTEFLILSRLEKNLRTVHCSASGTKNSPQKGEGILRDNKVMRIKKLQERCKKKNAYRESIYRLSIVCINI